MNLNGMLDRTSLSFSEFWTTRNARERAMLVVAALVVALGLYYALLIGPALNGRERLHRNLPDLRQQVAQMQAMSREAAALSGKPVAPHIPLSRENVESALLRNGLKPQNVMVSGDVAKVQLAAASFSGTLNWLVDMQTNSLLSVTDANIVALDQTDMVDATVTLRQSAHE